MGLSTLLVFSMLLAACGGGETVVETVVVTKEVMVEGTPQGPRATVPPVTRKEIVAWAMFDFANSSYTTVVVTFAFSLFFTRLVAAGPDADLWWGRSILASNLIVLLLSPLLGALAPDGTLLYETFAAGNEAYGRPSNPAFLLAPGDCRGAVEAAHDRRLRAGADECPGP